MNIDKQILIIKLLQKKHPTLHVGGSIGLLLHGLDLKRDLSGSDLDFCIDREIEVKNATNPGSGNDFHYTTTYRGIGIEVRVDPAAGYECIDGINVTNKEYILDFKMQYARKGYTKHILDLDVLGIPIEVKVSEESVIDDLPF